MRIPSYVETGCNPSPATVGNSPHNVLLFHIPHVKPSSPGFINGRISAYTKRGCANKAHPLINRAYAAYFSLV